MQAMSLLVLGLGLFFLGMQMVGENLRRLSSGTFRTVIAGLGTHPLAGVLVGTIFGAIMQSATAVTFILCGMNKSNLISARACAPIIVWSNVGLTALAFAATLNIHPIVAYGVGSAGIFFGMVRQSTWKAAAGVCLGVGLILFGLESMGAGAAPFHSSPWFRDLIDHTMGNPMLAFFIGILAAALLQSNTGAAMLVITLAGVGALELTEAALLIYGTNLGAIGLRIFLGLNLDRVSLRLVRFEDIFCLWTGVVMLVLFYVEQSGVPLVLAFVTHLSSALTVQLAFVFLLSNFLPAILIMGFILPIIAWLTKMLPEKGGDFLGTPRFLSSTAHGDFPSSLDLMAKEAERLAHSIQVLPQPVGADGESTRPPGFLELSEAIEQFGVKLASSLKLTEAEAYQLHLLRAELSIIRYLAEAVGDFNAGLSELSEAVSSSECSQNYQARLTKLLQQAMAVAHSLVPADIEKLRLAAKEQADILKPLLTEQSCLISKDASLTSTTLNDRFQLTAWMIHRYAKVLARRAENHN